MSVLHVQRREQGKVKPKHLRNQGVLPMALIQRDNTTTTIQASLIELKTAMAGADALGRLDLEVLGEGGQRKAIIKNIEQDYLRGRITHVTLQEVTEDDTIKVDVAVVPIGTPQAVEDGLGVLVHPTDHIKIKGTMRDIPDHIEVDVTGLEMTGHISAGDITLPDGLELLSSPDATLFSITSATPVELPEEAATEEEMAETEVPETAETEGDAFLS